VGTVAGDQSASDNWIELTGEGSDWLQLLVKEDSSTGHSLRVEARLQVPAGSNYDLYLYRSDSPDTLSCVNQVATSTRGPGLSEEASHVWDYEGLLGNGSDDSRVVTVEVRDVSLTCGQWTLRVQGPL
jgi:hypothetical protein